MTDDGIDMAGALAPPDSIKASSSSVSDGDKDAFPDTGLSPGPPVLDVRLTSQHGDNTHMHTESKKNAANHEEAAKESVT